MNNLGVKYKTMMVLTENMGEHLNKLVLDKEVLHMTSKAKKEKTQGPPLLKEGPAAALEKERASHSWQRALCRDSIKIVNTTVTNCQISKKGKNKRFTKEDVCFLGHKCRRSW